MQMVCSFGSIAIADYVQMFRSQMVFKRSSTRIKSNHGKPRCCCSNWLPLSRLSCPPGSGGKLPGSRFHRIPEIVTKARGPFTDALKLQSGLNAVRIVSDVEVPQGGNKLSGIDVFVSQLRY